MKNASIIRNTTIITNTGVIKTKDQQSYFFVLIKPCRKYFAFSPFQIHIFSTDRTNNTLQSLEYFLKQRQQLLIV